METTREERRKWMQWSRDAGPIRGDEFDIDFLRECIRDANLAEELLEILSSIDDYLDRLAGDRGFNPTSVVEDLRDIMGKQ